MLAQLRAGHVVDLDETDAETPETCDVHQRAVALVLVEQDAEQTAETDEQRDQTAEQLRPEAGKEQSDRDGETDGGQGQRTVEARSPISTKTPAHGARVETRQGRKPELLAEPQLDHGELVLQAGDLLLQDRIEVPQPLGIETGQVLLVDVLELELQLVPAYLLRAVEHPEAFEVIDEFRARVESADHFELYWWPHTDRVMTKTNTRVPLDAGRKPVGAFSNWIEEEVMSNGALALMCNLGHVAPGMTPGINRLATKVYGDREYTDHSYEVFTAPRRVRFREMEYALPLDEVPAALHELRAMIDASGWRISFPVEVRAAAPDENWLSTAHGRESGYIAVHRYVKDDPEQYFRAAEQIFLAHGGRPHWGKMHYLDAAVLRERYPHFDDAMAVRDRVDPDRVFSNRYTEQVFGR